MACERCGYSGAYSSHSCSRCNPPAPNSITPEQAKAIGKAGEHFGYNFVVYLPVITSILAFSYGVYRLAIWLELGDGAGSLPDWLAVVWLVSVILILILNRFFRGWVGWLFSLVFLVWFFTSPPSAEVASARERQEMLDQSQQLETELEGLIRGVDECRSVEDANASKGTQVREQFAASCAQLRADVDELLTATPSEVLRVYCERRDGRAPERYEMFAIKEPKALISACENMLTSER